MTSNHRLVFSDSRDLSWLESESIDLVVTSPPYPMIEMWDELFRRLEPGIGAALSAGEGAAAFEAMHGELDRVWAELYRVLSPGGMLCINVGDATRTLGGSFQLYPNHARILSAGRALGFQALPEILWRKPTNAPNKFVGSGTLPPGAYVTLEHEWVLLLRKGGPRLFQSRQQKARRLESAFFWEERNSWFSDVWELKGVRQQLNGESRRRSAAFPFELAFRLINMFSLKGDRVLDPFLGAGTTMLAAMSAARSSVGVEIDAAMRPLIEAAVSAVLPEANRLIFQRLERHLAFVEQCRQGSRKLKHESRHYGFPVVSRQEREILLNYLIRCSGLSLYEWEIEYSEKAALSLSL